MTQSEGGTYMCNFFKYERISTKEERELQRFTRQDKALDRYAEENDIEYFATFKDDVSGSTFNRPEWIKLEKGLHEGDTIVFKELSRFTRECENGYAKYMELLEKGINLIFLDNPTLNTSYIKQMMKIADDNKNRIARKSLYQTVELLLMVELDRVETERETISTRIIDGIKASDKKSGRTTGKLDKMTPELEADIKAFLRDRSIKQVDMMRKYNISRNTLKKYCKIINENQRADE